MYEGRGRTTTWWCRSAISRPSVSVFWSASLLFCDQRSPFKCWFRPAPGWSSPFGLRSPSSEVVM